MKKISRDEVIEFFKQQIARETNVDVQTVDSSENFAELGLNSINSIYILAQLESYLGISLDTLKYWDYPNIDLFSDYIVEEHFK